MGTFPLTGPLPPSPAPVITSPVGGPPNPVTLFPPPLDTHIKPPKPRPKRPKYFPPPPPGNPSCRRKKKCEPPKPGTSVNVVEMSDCQIWCWLNCDPEDIQQCEDKCKLYGYTGPTLKQKFGLEYLECSRSKFVQAETIGVEVTWVFD